MRIPMRNYSESEGRLTEKEDIRGERAIYLMHSNKLLPFISSQAHQSSLFGWGGEVQF